MSTRSADTTAADVLVVGEALVDIVEAAGQSARELVAGSPTNVALGLSRMGVSTRVVTAMGTDTRGHLIGQHLADSGVRIDSSSWNLPRTASAVATIGSDGSAQYRFDLERHLPEQPQWQGERVVHVGSVGAFLHPGGSAVQQLVEDLGDRASLTFDPNIRPALLESHGDCIATVEAIAARARVVKMSDEDAGWLYPGWLAVEIASRLLDLGAAAAVFTLGEDGAMAFARDGHVEIPAPQFAVRDTVGAGDTFMAALIEGMLRLDADADAGTGQLALLVRRAIAAASITVRRPGAHLPDTSEFDRAERELAMQLALQHSVGHCIF
jgi:fructokinase